MRKIRINNDIDVHLTVKRDGAAEDFGNKQVSVVMQVSYKKIPVTDFETDGNRIIFRFRAGEQRFLGLYSITVCVTDSEGGVNTVDKCDAFELVRCSCSEGGTDEPNIETVTLEYSLDLKTDAGGDASGGGGTGTSDYNDLNNKPRINNVILSGNKTAEQLGLQPKGDYLTRADIPDLKGEKGDKGDKGDTGAVGPQGEQGPKGDTGEQGLQGVKGDNGADGKSAYQIWLDAGNVGTENDYLASLKGDKGDDGAQGIQGEKGEQGIQGEQGVAGQDGHTPVKGVDYFTDADKTEIETAVVNSLPTRSMSITYEDDTTETILFYVKEATV